MVVTATILAIFHWNNLSKFAFLAMRFFSQFNGGGADPGAWSKWLNTPMHVVQNPFLRIQYSS